jgi:hypothetical protein
MTTFTIDSDNTVTAFATLEEARANGASDAIFISEKELGKLSALWPISRYAELWNNFAGVVPFAELKPVKKFANRTAAVARIWKAIQALTPAPAKQTEAAAPTPTKRGQGAKEAATPRTPREGSKKAIVLDLLRRNDGATLKEIMAATSWQSHSVRGFISGSLGKKMGLTIDSAKREDGQRCYHVA